MSIFTVIRSYFQYVSLISPPKAFAVPRKPYHPKHAQSWYISMKHSCHVWNNFLLIKDFASNIPTLVIAEKEVINFFAQNKISLVKEYGTCLTMPAKKITQLERCTYWFTDMEYFSCRVSLELINAASLEV